MDRSPRILVASPLARIITPALANAFPGGAVEEALDRDDVRRQVAGRVRYDVVIADLVWNHPDLEYSFDGLDVLDILRAADRPAPVILATQGHTIELDLLDEARLRPEIAAVFPKSIGAGELSTLVRDAAVGRRHIAAVPASRKPPLYEAFRSRKGQTAGRLAGAIAVGRATDGVTLAAAAGVAVNTANKVTAHYLGPIIVQRGEHDPDLPLTLPAVYRWCGLHARYIVSWCRRNGHADVLKSPNTDS